MVHVSTDLTRLSDTRHLELKPIDTLGILAVEIDDVIRSVDGLVSALRELDARQPIVLQVERDGKLTFIAFELD